MCSLFPVPLVLTGKPIAELNGNLNPGWWRDFVQLQIQIKQKSQLEFVPQDTSEFKSNQNLNSTLYREIPRNLIFSILTS
jgi:hypothetical protein